MPANRKISKGGSRLTLIRASGVERFEDAQSLYNSRRWHGAIYLAGYAIECLLKCAAGQRTGTVYLDSMLETHKLDILMPASGLLPELKTVGLFTIWSTFSQRWDTSLRYTCNLFRDKDGRLFFQQITQLYEWLWLRTR